MNRIRLIVIIVLMLGCIGSGIIGCVSTIRLPENINIVPPSPDLPPELAAFSGIWKGMWRGYHEGIVIVEKINMKKARVLFSFGEVQGYEARYFYRTLRIEDGPILRIIYDNGDQMTLKLNDDRNKLQGAFIEKKTGAQWLSELDKQDTL